MTVIIKNRSRSIKKTIKKHIQVGGDIAIIRIKKFLDNKKHIKNNENNETNPKIFLDLYDVKFLALYCVINNIEPEFKTSNGLTIKIDNENLLNLINDRSTLSDEQSKNVNNIINFIYGHVYGYPSFELIGLKRKSEYVQNAVVNIGNIDQWIEHNKTNLETNILGPDKLEGFKKVLTQLTESGPAFFEDFKKIFNEPLTFAQRTKTAINRFGAASVSGLRAAGTGLATVGTGVGVGLSSGLGTIGAAGAGAAGAVGLGAMSVYKLGMGLVAGVKKAIVATQQTLQNAFVKPIIEYIKAKNESIITNTNAVKYYIDIFDARFIIFYLLYFKIPVLNLDKQEIENLFELLKEPENLFNQETYPNKQNYELIINIIKGLIPNFQDYLVFRISDNTNTNTNRPNPTDDRINEYTLADKTPNFEYISINNLTEWYQHNKTNLEKTIFQSKSDNSNIETLLELFNDDFLLRPNIQPDSFESFNKFKVIGSPVSNKPTIQTQFNFNTPYIPSKVQSKEIEHIWVHKFTYESLRAFLLELYKDLIKKGGNTVFHGGNGNSNDDYSGVIYICLIIIDKIFNRNTKQIQDIENFFTYLSNNKNFSNLETPLVYNTNSIPDAIDKIIENANKSRMLLINDNKYNVIHQIFYNKQLLNFTNLQNNLYSKMECPNKNQPDNTVPYQYNVVLVNGGIGTTNPGDCDNYMNASLMYSNGNEVDDKNSITQILLGVEKQFKIILAQNPIREQIESFAAMLWNHDISRIVMICDSTGTGANIIYNDYTNDNYLNSINTLELKNESSSSHIKKMRLDFNPTIRPSRLNPVPVAGGGRTKKSKINLRNKKLKHTIKRI
jgi:hypothetical protein